MKYILWIIFIFTLMGCPALGPLYTPLTHPDQRIQLGGFSFLPPSGENWEVTVKKPYKKHVHWENWGRSKWDAKYFNKNLSGANPESSETEKLTVLVSTYEFALMDFDNDEKLTEFIKDEYKRLEKRGIDILESSESHEKFNGMNCIRSKYKGNSAPSNYVLHSQGHTCVHPARSNYIIKIRTNHRVVKDQSPTDFQSELDHFFNSLQFH